MSEHDSLKPDEDFKAQELSIEDITEDKSEEASKSPDALSDKRADRESKRQSITDEFKAIIESRPDLVPGSDEEKRLLEEFQQKRRQVYDQDKEAA